MRFLDDTAMPQLEAGAGDAIILLNAAYLWDRATLGVALYDGIDEVALAAVYDTHGTADRLLSLAPEGRVVTTLHGLNLLARRTPGTWPSSGEILVPGQRGAPGLAWLAPLPATYALAAEGNFPFESALEDMARRHDLPTARFAAKRLEYRAALAGAEGRGWWSLSVVRRPILLSVLGIALVIGLRRLLAPWRRQRRAASPRGMTALHFSQFSTHFRRDPRGRYWVAAH